jgi:hypothetical protein
MKWLVPRYPEEPGTLMILGSILSDPENLESSLNRLSGVVPIPERDVRDQSKAVRQQVQTELSQQSSLLLKAMSSSPLLGAGVAVEGHLTHGVETTVGALGVSAKVFIPTEEYMKKALEDSSVKKFAKSGLFAKSLYIIVGVATASKLVLKETQSASHGGSVDAQLAPPGSGTELATKAAHEKTGKSTSTLEVEGECDFAYRVREFQYSKIWRSFKDKRDVTEGALFGLKDAILGVKGGNTKADDGEYAPAFVEFEDEDESPSTAKLQELVVSSPE